MVYTFLSKSRESVSTRLSHMHLAPDYDIRKNFCESSGKKPRARWWNPHRLLKVSSSHALDSSVMEFRILDKLDAYETIINLKFIHTKSVFVI